jgi:hypothetical protein
MFYGRLKRLNGAALVEVMSSNSLLFCFGIAYGSNMFHFQAEVPSFFYAIYISLLDRSIYLIYH